MTNNCFIHHLKTEQPAVWQLLCSAQAEGLITIDEACDSITASSWLLWNYPGLHEALTHIINHWTENRMLPQLDLPNIFEHFQKP